MPFAGSLAVWECLSLVLKDVGTGKVEYGILLADLIWGFDYCCKDMQTIVLAKEQERKEGNSHFMLLLLFECLEWTFAQANSRRKLQ